MAKQNFFATRLATAIGTSDTTITLETPPVPTSGRLVLEARNPTQREIITYSGVSGNDITGVVRGYGGTTAKTHIVNSLVEMNAIAEDLDDILDAFDSFAAANSNGWTASVILPSTVTYNGNRSYSIVYPSSIAGFKSVGMRGRYNRTVAAPTQCADLESSSSQYFNKTSPAGTTFTDDFCAGAWIKLESYTSVDATIIGRWNGTSGWRFSVDGTTGTITLWGYNASSGNYSVVRSYASVPLGRWVHVAAQLDMSAFTATTTTSYVMFDGINVASQVIRAGTNPTALVQAGNLEIGADNGGSRPFDGKIAQAFYSSAKITQANMKLLIGQGLTSALCTTHSIVSAYSLSNSLTDINTTNANNLTAQNSAVATATDSPFANYGAATDPEYAITTAISADGLTETVQVAEGCALPTSGGIDAVDYSPHKVPHGFPADATRWDVVAMLKFLSQKVSPTVSTWYNENFNGIYLPVGDWDVSYNGILYGYKAGAAFNASCTLSTANNTESDIDMTSRASGFNDSANYTVYAQVQRRKGISITASAQYYLNYLAGVASSQTVGVTGENLPFVITARCAYI